MENAGRLEIGFGRDIAVRQMWLLCHCREDIVFKRKRHVDFVKDFLLLSARMVRLF
jgi:hypothetical protein